MSETYPKHGAGGPGSVSDEPLSAVVEQFDEHRDGGQFMPVAGGTIRCLTCRSDVDAAAVPAIGIRRLEGESDPADECLTVAVTCPSCGTSGALVVQYGPEAGEADADVLAAMPRPTGGGR